MKGIDLSDYQNYVDYMQVKADGIDFAIIRTGYGKNESQKDKLFEKHYAGLKYVGIKLGAYHYGYATSLLGAIAEAKNCLKFLNGKEFDLPIYYDLEESSIAKLGKHMCTNIALAFCEEIEKAGYKAGIYANLNWFNNYLDVDKLSQYSLWLAEWGVNYPTANFKIDYWQHTSKGQVNGISGYVDLNKSYALPVEKIVENLNYKSNEEVAMEVINGKWGNGEERKQKLEAKGFNYQTIQNIVNTIILSNNKGSLKVGDKVKVKKAMQYSGKPFLAFYKSYDLIELSGDRAVIGIGKTITCAINVNNIEKI